MISLNVPTASIARLRRRGHTNRVSGVSVDINADFHGRRRTGDPRLDLAGLDH